MVEVEADWSPTSQIWECGGGTDADVTVVAVVVEVLPGVALRPARARSIF